MTGFKILAIASMLTAAIAVPAELAKTHSGQSLAAQCLDGVGLAPEARIDVCTIVIAGPDRSHNLLAMALRARGDAHLATLQIGAAIADYDRSMKVGGLNAQALAGRAQALLLAGDTVGAQIDAELAEHMGNFRQN